MAAYTITLSDDHEAAVSYHLELVTAQAAGSDPPLEIPSRQQVVEQAVRGGLAVPYTAVQEQAAVLVPMLRVQPAQPRPLLLAAIASEAVRAQVARRLQEG